MHRLGIVHRDLKP